MENNRNHLLIAAALGLAFTQAASVFAGSAPAFTGPTVIYFVRHGIRFQQESFYWFNSEQEHIKALKDMILSCFHFVRQRKIEYRAE